MSFQYSNSCYLTVVDSGVAACANFLPLTMLSQDGLTVKSLSCASADLETGALNFDLISTLISSGASSVSSVSQLYSFAACTQSDYFVAFQAVFGAVLALVIISYGMWKIYTYLNWARGSE